MQPSKQQSHYSTRITCRKQYRVPLNLNLENQVSLTVPHLLIICGILTLIIQIFTQYSSVMFRKIYVHFALQKWTKPCMLNKISIIMLIMRNKLGPLSWTHAALQGVSRVFTQRIHLQLFKNAQPVEKRMGLLNEARWNAKGIFSMMICSWTCIADCVQD